MERIDYDDPRIEAHWLTEQREVVVAYLSGQAVSHGGIPTAPEWFVAPYVSIWRVISGINPPVTGWWAISGDLPTDYLSSHDAADARQAMREFARRWQTAAESMKRGEEPSEVRIGAPDEWPMLGDLLERRATLLWNWSGDDTQWEQADKGQAR